MGGFLRALVPVTVAWMAASGCNGKAATPPPVCSAPQGSSADAQSAASAGTAFAMDLYGPALGATAPDGNFIVSPYSVSAALTMVDVGAAGATDAQIQGVLHLSGNGATVAPAYAALACADETDGSADGQTLTVANSVWGQQGTAFESSFLSTLAQGYQAPLQQVDFESDANAAATSIDGWVSAQTQGQIPQLLQPGDLDSHTRLVLVNAVYFKGTWATGFDPAATSPKLFILDDASSVSVPMMDATVTLGRGTIEGGGYLYEIPYKGGGIAMDILLPAGSLTDMKVTPDVLGAAVASIENTTVELRLPKFSFKTTLALAPILARMGMPDLFDAKKADLSGMDGAKDLYVSAVVQQAMVEVDETGTVAAAATAASVSTSAVAEPEVIAIDHPFVFLIRDTRNGSILFMGQVQDPRQS